MVPVWYVQRKYLYYDKKVNKSNCCLYRTVLARIYVGYHLPVRYNPD